PIAVHQDAFGHTSLEERLIGAERLLHDARMPGCRLALLIRDFAGNIYLAGACVGICVYVKMGTALQWILHVAIIAESRLGLSHCEAVCRVEYPLARRPLHPILGRWV